MSDQPDGEVTVTTSIPTPEEPEELETLHSPSKLLRVAMGANILSWIMLVVVLAVFGLRLYSEIQQLIEAGMGISEIMTPDGISWAGNYLLNFALGFFYFFVLQGVSEGLNILADVFDTITVS